MPTRTELALAGRTHSCSRVYFRSSGNTARSLLGRSGRRRHWAVSGLGRASVTRRGSGSQGGDRRPARAGSTDALRRRPGAATSSTPPGMSSAAARVCGSPITSERYGEVSRSPSTTTAGRRRRGRPSNDVLATTRTPARCRISIASAPASRSSSIVSSSTSASTLPSGSVIGELDARAGRGQRCRPGCRAPRRGPAASSQRGPAAGAAVRRRRCAGVLEVARSRSAAASARSVRSSRMRTRSVWRSAVVGRRRPGRRAPG